MATPRTGRPEGRPKHKPTEESRLIVQLAAIIGQPHHDIAKLIGTGTRQLLREYRKELDIGKMTANMKVAGALYKNAMSGNVAAQIFWMKAQCGWRETAIHEHVGAGGRPIQHQVLPASVTEDDAMKAYQAMVSGTPLPGVVGHG
jgi:hypothetical protein